MIEIFSHDVSVRADEEVDDILIISGKGWENEPFNIYIKRMRPGNFFGS